MSMKFTYQFEERAPLVEVTIGADASLGEAFESFEAFLKASGYVFDGTIDLVKTDDSSYEKTK